MLKILPRLEVVYAVSDLDGVWTDIAGAVTSFGNRVLGLQLERGDYFRCKENIPSLFGFNPDIPAHMQEARNHWQRFCEEEMPHLPLLPGAEQSIQAFRIAEELLVASGIRLVKDIWTGRTHENHVITRHWKEVYLPIMRHVRHAKDWRLPNAHLISKASSLSRLPFPIWLYIEDELCHPSPVASAAPGSQVVLFEDPEKEINAESLPSNVLRIGSHARLAEFVVCKAEEEIRGIRRQPRHAKAAA